ncbi:MAG: restriction endonuclease subunit S [Planctomycetia bacterium]|nr:restriction endonuclease subunit S [Planctomycetia bacterium]
MSLIFQANYLEDHLGAEAFGTTGYAAVRPRNLLKAEIPLPALAEQRRIVSRVDAIAARVAEARRLREEAAAEIDRLCRAIIRDPSAGEPVPTPMRELVRQREPDVVVEQDKDYAFAGVYCFGRGVFRGQEKKGLEFRYDRLTTLQAGDFVYPKLMAWEGALAVVPKECDGLVVSTEFPVFEIDTKRVLPEVLDVYFRDPEVWPQLSGKSTGTNVRRRRLNPVDFLKYQFPLPPRHVQERLQRVIHALNTLHPLQSETAAELDALLPSVLNRAFAGEL